jgi:chromosome segregation ATPase
MEVLGKIKDIVVKLKKIKERKMEEFDFDELLNEVEMPAKEAKDEPRGLDDTDVVTDIIDDNGSGDSGTVDATTTTTVNEYKEIIKELNEEIKGLQETLKIAKTLEKEEEVEDFDFSDETKSFLKAWAELEVEGKELNERKKDLKRDYEEQGVHTKESIKAWKEYQKNLKETPDEAKEIERIKSMINKDDYLAGTATALVD